MRSSAEQSGDGLTLVEITPASVLNNFSVFFQEDAQFYLIEYKQDFEEERKEVALYGIKTIDAKYCEISLYVFQEFRFKLPYRKVLHLILQQPFELGFEKILIWTYEKSVATLLRQCQRLGVRKLETFDDCVWFLVNRS